MPARIHSRRGAYRPHRRALAGAVALAVLVGLAGLIAYLAHDDTPPTVPKDPPAGAASRLPSPVPPTTGSPSPPEAGSHGALPAPPSTHDPLAFGKAAAAALWSYDTRAYSQPELRDALHAWLTSETEYADTSSLEAHIPSPTLWERMADNGQYATATIDEAHFPAAFTEALRADPEALTEAYVYAVTVSGKQSIAWDGSPRGGAENRSVTLAVQCRPEQPCALSGVLPNVAP